MNINSVSTKSATKVYIINVHLNNMMILKNRLRIFLTNHWRNCVYKFANRTSLLTVLLEAVSKTNTHCRAAFEGIYGVCGICSPQIMWISFSTAWPSYGDSLFTPIGSLLHSFPDDWFMGARQVSIEPEPCNRGVE